MPKFPKREADILALAEKMIAGYAAHMADFSSHFGGPPWLLIKRGGYIVARKAQTEALAGAQVATEQKDAKLTALVEKMKAELKKSEVDVADTPEKLEYIGWGPRHSPQLIAAPGQPVNLRSIAESADTILLQWLSPQVGTGGPVRNYIVQRRQQPEGTGQFGAWSIVGASLNNGITLTDQPRGVQLEYRVKAINIGGESIPSNTAAVVL